MSISASEFLKWCQVFGIPVNGGGSSGSYQPNGGVAIHNFSDGNLLLTNPPKTTITVFGDDNPSAYIRLAAVNESSSLKEGANFQITNNCSVPRDIYDFSDESLYTVLPGVTVEGTLMNDATVPGIYSFKPISGDAPSGNYQLNNGYQSYSLQFTPNINLTIPTPTYIRVYGQTDLSSSVNLPNMSDPGAWPAGQEVSFFNDGDYRTEIYDALDQSLLIVPAKTIVTFVVTDNGSPGGFRFNISGADTFSQAQTNLQITGLQQTPLFFTATNVSGAPNQQSSFSNGANYPYVQYVQSGLSYAEVSIPMPRRWNQGTFTLRMEWYTTATSGNVVWNADAAIINSGDSLNPSFGTAVTVTSSAAGSGNTKIVATTGAITPSGTPSANSRLNIRIYRNGGSGSDNMAATAFLLNPVLLQWTASAGNDS